MTWKVGKRLYLNDLGPEDWTELSVSLDTLDSACEGVVDKKLVSTSVSQSAGDTLEQNSGGVASREC